MDKNLVVEIFVPEQGTRGERGKIATGYPIARHLILTVQHALYPANGRDESASIAIRWRHPRVTRDWQPIQGIAWESEQWDLALLQYELPLELGPWRFLSEQKPVDGMHWVSAGFPRVGGKKQKAREPFDMQGTVYSRMDDAEHFAIEERAGPTSEVDWKGASGSPVFVNWRILGVIVSVPEKLEAKRLWAVPMWRVLREDSAFRAKLGYDERETRRRSIQQKLADVLASVPARDALAKYLPGVIDETMGMSEHDSAECVAEHLLELEVGEAIETCQKAYADVKGRKAGDGQAIARAVQIILPAVYDHGVVEGVRHTRGDTNAALIELPAHYPTVAEIIMAGADRRESLFRPRRYEEQFPRGQLNLPAPPEGGFDGDGQRAIAALDRHLTGKLSLAYSDFERAVDDFMVCRFYHSVAEAPPRTAEQKIRGAAREIRYQAERQGKTYYLIVALPANRDDRQRLEMVLRSLRARYPGLVCLTLSHEGAVEEAEFHTFRDFVNLLPKIAESPS